METPDYQQFGPSDTSNRQQSITQRGLKNRLGYILYGVLVLLLLILLLVTGIKFSNLSKEIADLKTYLGAINHPAFNHRSSSELESPEDVLVEAITPDRGPCKEGWVSFEQSCYLLSKRSLSWNNAEQQCKVHGSHLLVVNSVGELDYISKVVLVTANYWIGLVERQHEGHWSWVDGTDFKTTQTFWDVGQPDDWDYMQDGEDCGQLHSSSIRKRKLWNDAECTLENRYICETRA